MRRPAYVLSALALLVFAIQLVPYGRRHANPDVTREPDWDGPRTRELFARACGDCHSNGTSWPWYSFVAPASWLVQRDVEVGRSHLNVSEWDHEEKLGEEAADLVRAREMPPWFYLRLHARARLSPEEREALATGLAATFGTGTAPHHHEHDAP